MGGIFSNMLSINLEENFRKNQEFIQSMNKIKTERQIQLMYQLKQREMALQIAKQRETCNWFLAFYVAAAAGLITGFRRTKRPYFLMPMLPLTFITLYEVDLAYGNKLHRIRAEAEHIMQFSEDLLEYPCGLPTPSSIDIARIENEEEVRIHPPKNL